jgi:hypothetical protein
MHRLDDSAVDAAAANVAIHLADDLLLSGIGGALKQRNRRNDHTGSAIGALEGFNIQKRLLDRMQAVRAAQAFDGSDFPSNRRGHGKPTGTLGSPVNQHGTSTTLPFAASVFCAGQAQIIAQNVEQRLLRLNIYLLLGAIDEKSDSHFVCA